MSARFGAVRSDVEGSEDGLSEEEVLVPARPVLRLAPARSPVPSPARVRAAPVVALVGGLALLGVGAVTVAATAAGLALAWWR